ncbi:hypothetical protein NUW58_g148 [Xylaria curta]|uniref:Uncharacterized protein n=1 Tax=Xylaria curta TaxID=42375 RepID=A0ACC1PRR3_9PEZI|nr:hypothetical protein NUW58_g148 [Xylaria curta]
MEKNPELIQDVDFSWDGTTPLPRVPLFLIHDGGGTTFAYHCLDPLRRPTYGVFNPRFHSGGRFEGGMRGMGRLYAVMIRQKCAEHDFPGKRNSDGRVDILIGGWSMGGLLSFEVAKALTGDRNVRVIGVLMMESPCPVNMPAPGSHLESLDHIDLGNANKNLILSVRAMREAIQAIREWDPPVWAGKQAKERPRFSLLRAVEFLPIGGKRVHMIDVHRHDQTLGWDGYDPELFTETLDVKGNHFEMFSFQHIPGISKAIKRCCDTLEKLSQSY